jgi:hypothetical protein
MIAYAALIASIIVGFIVTPLMLGCVCSLCRANRAWWRELRGASAARAASQEPTK